MEEIKVYSSMLSDVDIRKYFGNGIDIYMNDQTTTPLFDFDEQLQPASIDLHFRHECKRFKSDFEGNLSYQRLKNHDYADPFDIQGDGKLVIAPGEVIFTTTMETVVISNQFAGIITGRSSIARLGVMVHCCQEFINPGQKAPIALQITNLGQYPVELDISVPICQLILFKLSSPSSKEYNQMAKSKYRNETSPMPSQIYKESKSNDEKKNSNKKNSKFKKFFSYVFKIISPFLAPAITFLLINPILKLTQSTSVHDVLAILKDFKVSNIIVVVLIILYIINLRIGKK